jgi:hypothetical protein
MASERAAAVCPPVGRELMRQVHARFRPLLLLLLGCSIMAGGSADAAAQSVDQQQLAFLQEESRKPNGRGLVLVGATEKDNTCVPPLLQVGRMVDGKYQYSGTLTPVMRGFLSPGEFLPRPLPAGEYVIGAIFCSSGRINYTFNGPHAKFQVKAGELVEIGTLALHYQMDHVFSAGGTLKRAVEPYNPRLEAELRAKAPGLMAKLVRRRMVLIGPPDIRVGPSR